MYQQVLDLMQEDFQAKWLLMTAEVERGTRKDSHKLSSRAEDPAWFQDISSSARTKEEVMFRSCSARVRGYLARMATPRTVCDANAGRLWPAGT